MGETTTQGSFIARIWLERGRGSSAVWRGHIRHVHGEEECYFRNLSRMKSFLEEITHIPMPVGDED